MCFAYSHDINCEIICLDFSIINLGTTLKAWDIGFQINISCYTCFYVNIRLLK